VTAQNDAAFLRMFLLILGALVVFTVIILIIANAVTGTVESERGDDPRLRAAIAERIAPVGRVNVAGAPAVVEQAAPATDAPRSGEAIVASACASCHVAGVLNAPKIGDEAAWSKLLDAAGGVDGLTASAISGKGLMPPRGGAAASDAEIRAAVVHLLEESGVDTAVAGAAPTTPAGETPAVADAAEAAPMASPAPAPAPAPAGQGLAADARQMVADAGQAVTDAAAGVTAMVASAMPAAPQPAEQPAPTPAVAAVEPPAAAEAPTFDLAEGKRVYDSACFACHATGAAGAPKLGDPAAWAARIAQGRDVLFANSINGKGAMPPKGGRVDLPDDAIKAAVVYMLDAVP
jgi:cytochrome c5